MPQSHRVDNGVVRQGSIRPLVLLSLDDDELHARLAYELTASGFDVTVTDVSARRLFATRRPDIIVAALNRQSGIDRRFEEILGGDAGAHCVPLVALAADVSERTRARARQEGCVAVCLATCTGTALAMGLRTVLGPADVFGLDVTQTFD